MKLGKGKWIAIVAGVACLTVVAIATYVLRGPITEEWHIHRLASEDEATSLDAVRTLARLGSTRAIPALIALRHDLPQDVRELCGNDPRIWKVVGESSARKVIDAALAEIVSRPAAQVIPSFLRVLRKGSDEKRMLVLELIEAHVPDRTSMVPVLERALDDPVQMVAQKAIKLLENLGPAAAPAVHGLARKLDDASPVIRLQAVRALAAIGPSAGEAVPQLRAALEDQSLAVQVAAERALKAITPAEAVTSWGPERK